MPAAEVQAYGLQSITNLIVRRRYGDGGPVVALNAHGDVVPPGDGWRHDPYGAQVEDGFLYGRAAAVSKSDFASFTFAVRALESLQAPLAGGVELHFTYDEEFGGEMGPGWLLKNGLTRPDLLIAAGFSYEVVVAHNGCLQMEVTVHGDMSHAAIPDSGTDALQGAVHILQALYRAERSVQAGDLEGGGHHPPLPERGLDRRRHQHQRRAGQGGVQAGSAHDSRGGSGGRWKRRSAPPSTQAVRSFDPPRGGKGIRVEVRRLLLARAMVPLPGNQPLVEALQRNAQAVFGETIPAVGTPLYTDVRLYTEAGIPGVIYGAGPRTVLESNAKRADERLKPGRPAPRHQGRRPHAARPAADIEKAGLPARPFMQIGQPRAESRGACSVAQRTRPRRNRLTIASRMIAPTSETRTDPMLMPSLMVPTPTIGEMIQPPRNAPMMPTITFSRMPCCPSVRMIRLASQPTTPPTINQMRKPMMHSLCR